MVNFIMGIVNLLGPIRMDSLEKKLSMYEIELVEFKFRYTYDSNGDYTVSYVEDFRNVGIINEYE